MMPLDDARCAVSSRSAAPQRIACWNRLRLHPQVAPGHDVVEHAHALEQRQALEGARDAHLGDLARVHVREGPAAQADRALLRLVDAVDAVEHRALAGAVRADDRADLVLADVEADVGERLDAAEAQADVAAPRGRPRRCRRAAPSPACCQVGHGDAPAFTPRAARREGLGVDDLQVGRDRAGAAVLERHLRSRCSCSRLAAVERVDQHAVLLADEAAPDLARARQLAVVGVELLVQDQEAADLAAGQRARRRRGRR